jgi:hypothetical protein
MNLYPWLVFLHVVGGFAFVLAHGASVMVAFRVRHARDPATMRALLDLSEYSMIFALPALLVVLASGIGLGFWGGHWGRLWIWISLGLLIGIAVSMGLLGTAHYSRMRHAAKVASSSGSLTPELAGLRASRRPFLLAAIGGIGLLAILWLMAFKPL